MAYRRLIIPFLILVTAAVFCRAAFCGFVSYDDPDYVTDNRPVLNGLTFRNVAWAFTGSHADNYHPLTWLSLMLDSTLMGDSPRGYHITNIVLHGLAVVLLYLALEALTGAAWRSALVALCFAIHPLRVESVAWITERKDVLSGCLGFAALLAYAAYAHRPSWGRYVGVAILFILGLLAKPILVTLPCLFLLLDVWPLRRVQGLTLPAPSANARVCPPRLPGWLVLEKLPLLACSGAFGMVTLIIQHESGTALGLSELPLGRRLINVPINYIRYLQRMVWFRGMIVIYPYHEVALWKAVAAAAALALITVVVLIRFRPNPWLAIGWFWFLGMLAPVSGIVQSGSQSIADRYTYLSTIGLSIMLIWSVPVRLWEGKGRRLAVTGAVAAGAVVLAAFTWRQIGYWHDGLALFSHAVLYSPHNPVALTCLGTEEQQLGNDKAALACFQCALALLPDGDIGHLRMGELLEQMAERSNNQALFDQAKEQYRLAILFNPHSAGAYNGMGLIYTRRREFDRAIEQFQRAADLDPDAAPAQANLGVVLVEMKRYAQALPHLQRALSLKPDEYKTYFPMAKALAYLGRFQETLPYLRGLIARQPNDASPYAALGEALLQLNRSKEAIPALRQAVKLQPGNAEYRAMLAQAQAAAGLIDRPFQADSSQPASPPW